MKHLIRSSVSNTLISNSIWKDIEVFALEDA